MALFLRSCSAVELVAGPWRLPGLLIQRRAVLDATSHELWPVGYDWLVLDSLGEQRPQVRMVPAQVMTRAVAVCSDPRAQSLHLGDEVRSKHVIEIVIHGISLVDERDGADARYRRPTQREARFREPPVVSVRLPARAWASRR